MHRSRCRSVSTRCGFDRARRPGSRGGKQTGLLTVSESGLEFSAKKRSHVLPWSRVETISYGPMAGDVDTMWVVLSLHAAGEKSSRVGLRDGHKMGFGRGTTAIFDAIVSGLRQASAGPFAVPQGHSAYITPFLQFALALPDGWHPYAVSETYVEGRPLWGRTIFAPRDLAGIQGDETVLNQALKAMRDGAEPAVFLDRFDATDGLTCRKLTRSGRSALRTEIAAALRSLKLVSEPNWTETKHRECRAWTFAGQAARRNGETIDVRFYAVSDGRTAYLFGMRGGGNERFEPLARSLKTAPAR